MRLPAPWAIPPSHTLFWIIMRRHSSVLMYACCCCMLRLTATMLTERSSHLGGAGNRLLGCPESSFGGSIERHWGGLLGIPTPLHNMQLLCSAPRKHGLPSCWFFLGTETNANFQGNSAFSIHLVANFLWTSSSCMYVPPGCKEGPLSK